MNLTPIEWTDFSANPLKFRTADGRVVWACEKLSPGCTNCYAEDLSHRYGGSRRAGDWNAATMATLTPFLDEAELRKMLTYKPAAGKRCFVGDMTDVFGSWVPDALLDRLFAVFALRPDVTWQILTKRAERMREYVSSKRNLWNGIPDFVGPTISTHDQVEAWCKDHGVPRPERERRLGIINNGGGFDYGKHTGWPLANVWLGVSVENQRFADERIPLLLQTPAAVRFISAEPLLGSVDLKAHMPKPMFYCAGCGKERFRPYCSPCQRDLDTVTNQIIGLDWVIVGGESGEEARPFAIEWARSIAEQCRAAGVPVFVKQLGAKPYVTVHGMSTAMDDGQRHEIKLRDRKGGDPSEWPEDLRVREFPRVEVPA